MDTNEILAKYKSSILEHSYITTKELNKKLGNIFNINENIFINKYEDKINNSVGFSIATLILSNNNLDIEYKGLDPKEKIVLDQFLQNVKNEKKETIEIDDLKIDFYFIDSSTSKEKKTFEIAYEGKIKLDKSMDSKAVKA